MSLESMVGRQLIVGLPGPDATDDDLRHLHEIHAGGLMLYRRNFETPERFLRFIRRLEEGLGRRLTITTDHEGGRIIMLNRGVTIFPDNLAAGTADDETMVERQGAIEGRELRRLGVDISFGPCIDVLTDRYSPNIGIRSYGKDPAIVSSFGVARIRGLQEAGLSACAKHFPGKGHAPVDAHLGLPTIESGWAEMEAVHIAPFRAAIEAGVDCVMTSHPVYPKLDPTPATFVRLASMAHTQHCAPNSAAISAISSGRSTAAVLTLTLSAPARSIARASSAVRMPPPTVNGMKTCSAVRDTTSTMVSRPSDDAVMSRKTSSSAPSAS